MLLAVDTSTQTIGLAIYNGWQVVCETIWQSQNHHTVEVAPAMHELLHNSGIKANALQALAVASGPGSFTSLRIGLALVKGMALALHLPVVSLPTLDILAAGQPIQDYPMAAILQAGRGRLAVGWYRANGNTWESQGKAEVVTIQQLSTRIHHPTLVCGELNADERQLLARKRRNVLLASPAQCTRRPGVLAELAWKRWQEGHIEDPVALSPIYLHVAEEIPQ
jgi:tRNA threonylcarbamoyladenosine biosynthesis protein TsaB